MSSITPAPPPPEAPASQSTPRVLAVVVTRDGAEWVAGALRTLAAQGYPALEVMAVDNASTDGTAAVLTRRLDADRVLTMDRNVGFGRAVAAALRTPQAEGVDYVLLVHDDMALMPDAVQWLVGAMEADPTLSVVGPKLREWDEEPLLQQVGMSADAFLRAESHLDPGELDQGQHDGRGDVLYVSTAGMLLRRDVFSRLGGFDARFESYRDDMDLCWRVWLAGRRVGVVPRAIGYHQAAGSNGTRRAGADLSESRYLIERHTLAAMLKNYSGGRLAWIIPLGLLLNLARVLAMLLSRRFGDAFAVVRAYAWNLGQLRATLRRRQVVQSTRRQPDGRLSSLFTPGLPRLREYSETLLEAMAGGSTRALVDADDIGRAGIDPLAQQPIQRFLRDRPLVLLGVPLLLAFFASIGGFMAPGPIVGGEIAAWPASPQDFITNYLSPWGGEPLASPAFPSPVQPVLGLASALVGGSAWLAQRILVFGMLPLAFLTTLRAGRLVTRKPWPRVVGATVYVLSPVVLGTLSQGRYGLLVLAALLPAVVSLTITTTNRQTPPGVAWRSTALLALAILLTLGAAPIGGLMAPAIVILAAALSILRGWLRPLLRLCVGGGAALMMLSPWLLDLFREGGPAGGTLGTAGSAAAMVDLPLWRAMVGQPPTVTGLGGTLGVVLIAIPAAVLLGALFVGMRARPLITGSLVLLVTTSGAAAWAAAYYRLPLVHPPALLLPGAVGLAVLAIIVVRWSTETLVAADFGVAQVGTAVAGVVLAVGLVAGLGLLAGGPWQELRTDPQLVPAFIGADQDRAGPYRVLLVDRAEDGTVRWEVTDAEGPEMTAFGTLRNRALTDLITQSVTQTVAGAGSAASAPLGVLNIRYVVLTAPDTQLQAALSRQVDLEPLPSTAAVTYRVRTWLPRAGIIGQPAAARLLADGDPGPTGAVGAGALQVIRPGDFQGAGEPTVQDGLLVVSEGAADGWRAVSGGQELAQVDAGPINAFEVPDPGQPFRAVYDGGLRRRVVVAAQLLIALAMVSLAIRPPGARAPQRRATSLPSDLVGLADTTMALPRIDPDNPPPEVRG
ncbi:MAG TPA: glycosyltransferase family 2 protein [Euzebya sp.]|nr:glycosyltransferase family 2 protein [Euzebya sp.]